MTVLQASGVEKRFGGVMALQRGDLVLRPGEVHALIGSNGSGKSTLCKIIAGSVAMDKGRLALDDRELVFTSPRDAASEGIGAFYQELSLIPAMTVAENIFLWREPHDRAGLVDRKALNRAAAEALSDFAGVLGEGVHPEAYVADLSADQRQIVEILKTLAANPRFVILDEATAALDHKQVAVLFDKIRRLKADGRSIVIISHRLDEVFEIADEVTVMRNGMTVMTKPVAETTRDEVVTAMIGQSLGRQAEHGRHKPGEDVVLEAKSLSAGKLDKVSFALRRGEILGLGGLHGQGQSELLRCLFGAEPLKAGTIAVNGAPAAIRSPIAAMRHGMAYVSGDRSRYGVLAIRPIFENLVISLLAKERRKTVAEEALRRIIGPAVEQLKLKFADYADAVSSLSGGNQQKVVIARWLATAPQILLLDDPTKGIDIETKRDLYRIMDELCERDVSIVLYSSDDAELLSTADRVLVFNGGRIVAELAGEKRTEFELYRAAYSTGAE